MAGARKCASCFAKEAVSSAVERHHPGGREPGAAGTASEGAGRETEAGAPEEADALEALLSEIRSVERQIARGATPEFRARMLDKARKLRSEIKRLEQKRRSPSCSSGWLHGRPPRGRSQGHRVRLHAARTRPAAISAAPQTPPTLPSRAGLLPLPPRTAHAANPWLGGGRSPNRDSHCYSMRPLKFLSRLKF